MQHHERAVERYVARVSTDQDVLAVVISGSVARGTARADSDVDLYLVVTEERWAAAFRERRLMYVETEDIGYPGGYFDIKLATLSYLDEAAERGDDPVRDSFAASRIVFSRIPDLAERIDRVTAVSAAQWRDRVAGFVAQCRLHGGYFLPQAAASGERMLLAHASVHLATAAGRAMLAHNRVFFSGPKYLTAQVGALPQTPAGFSAALAQVVAEPTAQAASALLALVEAEVGETLPPDETLSRFVLDNELAWRYAKNPPEYS